MTANTRVDDSTFRPWYDSLWPSETSNRATARDIITHRNQYKIHFRMASKTRGTNVRHTRATVTALLEFLYKWMPLHLVYTIAMVVCEETRRYSLQSKRSSLNLPWDDVEVKRK